MGEWTDYTSTKDDVRPILRPTLRVSAAFVIVFGFAGAIYYLMGLGLGGVVFYLSIGAVTVLSMALVTRFSISRHYDAKILSNGESPRLDVILNDLSRRFRIERPRLMLVPSEEPNAFAFGFGRRTYIGVTSGLVSMLDDKELTAVIAHEFAHVWNRDSVTQVLAIAVKKTLFALAVLLAIAVVLAGMIIAAVFLSMAGSRSKRSSGSMMIVPLAMGLGVFVLSPIAIGAGQCLFSRRAEFRADECSTRVTGKPEDLARALIRIDQYPSQCLAEVKHGVYSSLWISSRADLGMVGRLLSSHPPVKERVRKLVGWMNPENQGEFMR